MKKKHSNITNNSKCYLISQYNLDDVMDLGKLEVGMLSEVFFTKNVFNKKWRWKYPFVSKYNLDSIYGEKELNKTSSLAIYCIANNDDYYYRKNFSSKVLSKEIVASITFLYKQDNSLFNNEDDSEIEKEKKFRINIQESGRLLLLLKKEIEEYAIGYLMKDKALDLWEQKFWSARRFEKNYANSAHVFNSVYKEMDEFEKLDKSIINSLSKTWFFLTNETISFLYSDIERNEYDSIHYLDLHPDYIEDVHNTLGKTFSSSFLSILSSLLKKRWNESVVYDSNGKRIKNRILINGVDLNDFVIGDNLKKTKIYCNKHIIRTFIAQCLHNSLSIKGKHGHRGANEIKLINIKITNKSIIIEDSCINEFYSQDDKIERTKMFNIKKQYIKGMRCDEYSSTTLTSLQGVVDYMCDIGYNFSCDFYFNQKNNFVLTINFK